MAPFRARLNGITSGQRPETNGTEPSETNGTESSDTNGTEPSDTNGTAGSSENGRAHTPSTGTPAEQSEQVRAHSFQIVRLQNQIESIQNARRLEAVERTALRDAVRDAAGSIVDLKSRLAGLTIEFHMRSSAPRSSENGGNDARSNGSPAQHRSVTSVPQSLERRLRATSEVAETVAVNMFGARRTLPARRSYVNGHMSQSLSPATKNQLEELDQRAFFDAQESLASSPIEPKPEEDDDSFALDENLLRAPTADKSE